MFSISLSLCNVAISFCLRRFIKCPTPIRILSQTPPGPRTGRARQPTIRRTGFHPRIDDDVPAVAAEVRRHGLAAAQTMDHCRARGCALGGGDGARLRCEDGLASAILGGNRRRAPSVVLPRKRRCFVVSKALGRNTHC